MFKNNYLRIALLLAALAPAGVGAAQFSFVAMGDTPYHLPGDFVRFERLIARINGARPAFIIHVGDIKAGNSRCDDEYFVKIAGLFATFEKPLIYTPGDNEWTDCHRADSGGYDPLERLAKIRELFFAAPAQSLGRETLALEHQGTDPGHAAHIENRRWERSGVVFATLHIVGSSNNLQRNTASANEYFARNAANLAWMAAAFARAKEHNAKAVVLAFQADLGWELDGFDDRRAGFNDTLNALRRHAREFTKPVLVIHGDRHRFVVDKPLRQYRRLVTNVTRVMVFGDAEVHGVVVNVDTNHPDVFSIGTLMVPENIPAAPKP